MEVMTGKSRRWRGECGRGEVEGGSASKVKRAQAVRQDMRVDKEPMGGVHGPAISKQTHLSQSQHPLFRVLRWIREASVAIVRCEVDVVLQPSRPFE